MAVTPPLKRMLLTIVFGIGAGVALAALVHYLSGGATSPETAEGDDAPDLPCDELVAADHEDATPRCACPPESTLEHRDNGDQACIGRDGIARGPALVTADGARRYCVYEEGELRDGDSQCPAL